MSKFTPKLGQKYYMINSRFKVTLTTNTGSTRSKGRIKAGNAFKKHRDAELFLAEIKLIGKSSKFTKKWWEFWK